MENLAAAGRSDIEATAQGVIDSISLPPEITHTRVHEDEDADGDLVLRVTLQVESDDFGKETTRRLVDAIYEIRTKLLAANLKRFPHVRIEQAA